MKAKTYDKSFSTVYNATLGALRSSDMSIERENKEKGEIVASTGLSLLSWGEAITVKITREGTRTKVNVLSTPKSQLFDWGKSNENERIILNKIDEYLG